MKGMKPVKVYSCSDRVQADMLTEALRREGIPSYAESGGSGDYLNIYMGTSVFGETIYVDENDTAKAKKIIAGITGADISASDSDADREPIAAPTDKKIIIVRIISLAAALLLLIGAVAPCLMDIFRG